MLHGYTPPSRFLPYLSFTQVAALPARADTVIVLPAGSVEQHGAHLPCAVDVMIAAAVVGHALARLPVDVPAFALPPLTYGQSVEHEDFPGTLTLEAATVQATVEQIGASVWRAGFRKLLIVNGHGGQPQVLELAALQLRRQFGDFVVVPKFVWHLPHVAGQFLSATENRLAMHAGHAETALMLALAPETVHMDRAAAHYPPEFDSPLLAPKGRPACAWMSADFGDSGVIGDPTGATAEQGRAILDSLADSWAQAITELHRLHWPARAGGTAPT
jgi:creatinine amidohydrolase